MLCTVQCILGSDICTRFHVLCKMCSISGRSFPPGQYSGVQQHEFVGNRSELHAVRRFATGVLLRQDPGTVNLVYIEIAVNLVKCRF